MEREESRVIAVLIPVCIGILILILIPRVLDALIKIALLLVLVVFALTLVEYLQKILKRN